MSFIYTPAKFALAKGATDLSSATIFAALVMTNTTADTLQDAKFMADVALDECDSAVGYDNTARVSLASGQAVTEDDTDNMAEYAADAVEWSLLAGSTRQIQGVVLYKGTNTVANDATNELIAFIDTGGFPFTANGSDVVITWNADGILQVA